MAAEDVEITVTFSYDPAENNNIPATNFLYHYLTRLNREIPIKSIEYKGATREFDEENPIEDIPLKVVDSILEEDRPAAPDLSEVTVLSDSVNPIHPEDE